MWGTPQKKRAAARIGQTCFASWQIMSTSKSRPCQSRGAIHRFRPKSGKMQDKNGGEGGIRTPVTLSSNHAFQACAFNHSATSPASGLSLCEKQCQAASYLNRNGGFHGAKSDWPLATGASL